MKVFISADMEGLTGTTRWDECDRTHPSYPKYARIMTEEVVAACRGAFAAGATEIVVKDSHESGCNIDIEALPEGVELIRSWSGSPFSMVDGIDGSFDACMFIGYHSAAGCNGNPLSHTMTGRPCKIRINGELGSEFLLYSYAAALVGVPTVLLTGDKQLCEDSMHLHPYLETVAVKDGRGGITINKTPKETQKLIQAAAEKALRVNLAAARASTVLPPHFEMTIEYKEQTDAVRKSHYPGCVLIDERTIRFETDNFYDILTAVLFLL